MEDREIVALFFKRSERAVEITERKYGRYCFAVAKNILGNEQDAEECVNEALHAIWNSIPPQTPANLKAYSGKIVREIAISRWRADHAEKRYAGEYPAVLEELEEIAADDDLERAVTNHALACAISAFLRSLPASERALMIRRYWYNDSIRELTKRFGFGESKVKVTLKRTRDKLARYLKKEGFINEKR